MYYWTNIIIEVYKQDWRNIIFLFTSSPHQRQLGYWVIKQIIYRIICTYKLTPLSLFFYTFTHSLSHSFATQLSLHAWDLFQTLRTVCELTVGWSACLTLPLIVCLSGWMNGLDWMDWTRDVCTHIIMNLFLIFLSLCQYYLRTHEIEIKYLPGFV